MLAIEPPVHAIDRRKVSLPCLLRAYRNTWRVQENKVGSGFFQALAVCNVVSLISG